MQGDFFAGRSRAAAATPSAVSWEFCFIIKLFMKSTAEGAKGQRTAAEALARCERYEHFHKIIKHRSERSEYEAFAARSDLVSIP